MGIAEMSGKRKAFLIALIVLAAVALCVSGTLLFNKYRTEKNEELLNAVLYGYYSGVNDTINALFEQASQCDEPISVTNYLNENILLENTDCGR